MKKIFITGGTGVLGRTLIQALQNKGYEITALSRNKSIPGCNMIYGDIDSFDYSEINGCSAAIHLAGDMNPSKNYDELYAINVRGTEHVVKTCNEAGINHLIFTGSTAVYGKKNNDNITEMTPVDPDTPYARTKYLAEEAIKKFNGNSCILRPCSIFGEGYERKYVEVYNNFKTKKIVIFGNGKNHIPFIHKTDVVRAILLVLKNDGSGTYNLCHDFELTQIEMLEIFFNIEYNSKDFIHVSLKLFVVLIKLYNVIRFLQRKKKLPLEPLYRVGIDRVIRCDKFKKDFPFTIDSNLNKTIGTFFHEVRKLGDS